MGEVATFRVHGKGLRCQHCGHDRFRHETTSVDRTAWGGLFRMEGGHRAEIYICASCGFLHWFFPVIESSARLRDSDEHRPIRVAPAEIPDEPREPTH
jgi:hypothetical protein